MNKALSDEGLSILYTALSGSAEAVPHHILDR